MRPTLESSSYLISVCGLFLRQGPRLALCSLREKGGRWNKTEKPSWGAGRLFSAGPSLMVRACTLGFNHQPGAVGRGQEAKRLNSMKELKTQNGAI